MNNDIREHYLKLALVASGIAFLLIYPLGLVWPSGWVWHGGEGSYYLQMISGVYAVLGIFLIAAARNPAQNGSLISFTIWSSVVHAAVHWVGKRKARSQQPGLFFWSSKNLLGGKVLIPIIAASVSAWSPHRSLKDSVAELSIEAV